MKFDSDPCETYQPSPPKSIGRQRSQATILLTSFQCKRSSKHPKKEIIRCEVIRGMKRAIRQLREGKIPAKGWHGFELSNKPAVLLWNSLRRIVHRFDSILLKIANTETGPKTDGKIIKERGGEESRFNSFNDAFCRWFYREAVVRWFHRLYVELVFGEGSPERMAEKMPFVCCSGSHVDSCSEKWAALKHYIQTEMISELSPGQTFPRPFLPTILISQSVLSSKDPVA